MQGEQQRQAMNTVQTSLTETDTPLLDELFGPTGGTALIEVVKISEAMYNGYEPVDASVTFGGFWLQPHMQADSNSCRITTQPVPEPSADAPRLEFIGDSITCGYGAVGDAVVAETCSGGTGVQLEDYDMTWGAEVCRQLGAVCHTTAWSGRGMLKNYADGPEGGQRDSIKMPALWRQTLGSEPAGSGADNAWFESSQGSVANFRPDGVLINLGTNVRAMRD